MSTLLAAAKAYVEARLHYRAHDWSSKAHDADGRAFDALEAAVLAPEAPAGEAVSLTAADVAQARALLVECSASAILSGGHDEAMRAFHDRALVYRKVCDANTLLLGDIAAPAPAADRAALDALAAQWEHSSSRANVEGRDPAARGLICRSATLDQCAKELRAAVLAAPSEREPLTDGQIVDALLYASGVNLAFRDFDTDVQIARAIERAHGIGKDGAQ